MKKTRVLDAYEIHMQIANSKEFREARKNVKGDFVRQAQPADCPRAVEALRRKFGGEE